MICPIVIEKGGDYMYIFKGKKVNEDLFIAELYGDMECADNCSCNGGCGCSASASGRK